MIESVPVNSLYLLLIPFLIFTIVLLRYLFFSFLYLHFIRKFFDPAKSVKKQQFIKELKWSATSSLIFALMSTAGYIIYLEGYTKIYTTISDYSISYFIFSIIAIAVLYETYYYWLHRWMHKPLVFKQVHKVHHESKDTSVFTSFSFHPLEAFLQFVFLPVIVMIMPIHYAALAIILMIMTVSAIMNHADVEVFPKHFSNHFIGKWLIGSTHHSLHHKHFDTNYGLYFTCWDKWMKTEHKEFHKEFLIRKRNITCKSRK
jgi:Delta7-sterol 5-desaturase